MSSVHLRKVVTVAHSCHGNAVVKLGSEVLLIECFDMRMLHIKCVHCK